MLLPLLLLACAPSSRTPGVGEAAAARPSDQIRLPGIADVACDGADCRALVSGSLLRLPDLAPLGPTGALAGADTLRFATAWEVEGPCEPGATPSGRCVRPLAADGTPGAPTPVVVTPPPLDDGSLSLTDAAESFAAAWNHGLAQGWRSGFFRVIVGPGDGRITWLRGLEGAGQLVRAGAGSRTVRLGAASSAVSFPAWLAIHPTGVEAYLVAWPAPVVRAFDPAALDVRWTLPVDGAAQGLFVDPGGRWLVVGIGPGTTDRFVDWPTPRPDAAATADPFRDEVVRTLERPPMDEVLVIDIAAQAVVARAPGTFRRFLPLARPVLVTDRAITFLVPGDFPS